MSADWYKKQPKNRNYLSPLGFKLNLELFDGVDFFCQAANIPDLTMPVTEVPTRFRSVPIIPGGGVTFGDFTVTFIIDEDLQNYESIQKWIRSNGNADSSEDVPDLPEYSRGELIISTSNYNANFSVNFSGLFPIALSGVQFDTRLGDQEYLSADVTFKYHTFSVTNLREPTSSSIPVPSVTLSNNSWPVVGPLEPTEQFNLQYTSSYATTLNIDRGVGSVRVDKDSIVITGSDVDEYKVNVDNYFAEVTFTITAVGPSGTSTATTTVRFKRPQTSANRVCIAVIDENNNNSLSSMESKWLQFKNNWPDRSFFLLQPGSCASPQVLNAPLTFMEQTDPTSIINPCTSTLITAYDSNYGLYLSTSQSTAETPAFTNGTVETTIDNINKYGVFRMGLEQGCGDMSDIITLLQNATNLSKVLTYLNNGGVLWINAEWISGGCSNQSNVNTILTLLGSNIQMDGDLSTSGNMNRSNNTDVISAGFPATLYHNATGKFTGGTPIYQVTESGTTHDTFVYEELGNGILVVSADVNTYQDNTYDVQTNIPPSELYSSLRSLVA
jgi:hypothetical protein